MNVEILKSMASRYLGRGIYQLIELRHPNFTQDWNFVNGGMNSNITIDGTVYETLPFALTLSPQGENAGASIAIANVDRRIAEELTLATDNTDIEVTTYLAHIEKVGTTVTAERYPKGTFTVVSAEVTQDVVALGIALKSSLGYNISSLRFNKNDFSNIYL